MNDGPVSRPRLRPGAGPFAATGVSGFSLVELMLAVGIMLTMSAIALGMTKHMVERYRAAGAARYMAARLQRARAEAIARGANVALSFTSAGDRIGFRAFLDGNRNGVLSADIADGVDVEVTPMDDLASFPGVSFGMMPGLVAPDGEVLSGADPIRFGAARLASFTPRGTATSGSLYISGAGLEQYVVRVYGDTGKTYILRFDVGRRAWMPL